jgi:ethanolamine utilization protein EutA (predicted chaperonin)
LQPAGFPAPSGTPHGVLSDGSPNTSIQTHSQNLTCIVELDDYTAGGTISNIRFVVKGFLFNTRSGDTDIQVIITNSSNDALYTETVTLNFNSYIEQTHTGTERTTSDGSTAWSDSDLDGLRLVIYTSADPPGASAAAVTEAYIIVTYEAAATGYANDVMGVASGNIGKVITVATANIDKVIGV